MIPPPPPFRGLDKTFTADSRLTAKPPVDTYDPYTELEQRYAVARNAARGVVLSVAAGGLEDLAGDAAANDRAGTLDPDGGAELACNGGETVFRQREGVGRRLGARGYVAGLQEGSNHLACDSAVSVCERLFLRRA